MAPSAPPTLSRDHVDVRLWEASEVPSRPGRALTRRVVLLVGVAVVACALVGAGVGRGPVVRTGGLSQLGEFFQAALHPRVDSAFLALTGTAAMTTLAYAALGTGLSVVIGCVGGILSSQTWWQLGGRRGPSWPGRAGWAMVRVALVIPRGIHEVLWGLLFLSIFGIQPIVAVLAIGIPFGAVTAKVFSEILDETGQRPCRALVAAGAGRFAALCYGLLPPALSDLLSYSFYRFECAIRSAAILGLVGVGGLGFQLQLSFQALQYREIWTLLYALILLCALTDLWSWTVRGSRGFTRRGAPTRSARDRRVLRGSVALVLVMIPVCVWWTGLDPSVVWSRQTLVLTGQLLHQAWPPSFGDGGPLGLLRLAAATLAMSLVAIAFAVVGGALLAFPAANQSQARPSNGHRTLGRAARLATLVAARGLLIVMRAIPPPVWALLMLFILFPGIVPAALALGVYTLGVLGRLMAEAVENLDRRPLQALRAHGAAPAHTYCYGVLPAAAPRFVAYGLYRWEVTIRETMVVGVVGAGGLGLLLNQQLAAFDYAAATTTVGTVILLTLLVDFTSAAIRRILR
jgi:phosphonate transport system permease protein